MSSVPKVTLAGGLEVCRILNGMWQVSGAHGTVNTTRAVEAMQAYTDAGLTTFDMADIYGPAEDIFGQFSSQLKSSGKDAPALQALTKYVPKPGPMERKVTVCVCVCVTVCVLPAVRLDSSSREQHVFLLKQTIALTNFDTQRMEEITNKGIRISSNQVTPTFKY
uniref:NADP-dependent oxidoreductase domain-containing protein n=1 Tax=Oryzias melastigma TaxID=30732 RepID=A0A3B3BIX2_ORYME